MEYIIVYGYAAIYKHEIVVNVHKQLSGMVFNLWVMEVPISQSKHYIGFIEQNNKSDICIDIEDILKVNFDTNKQVKTEN